MTKSKDCDACRVESGKTVLLNEGNGCMECGRDMSGFLPEDPGVLHTLNIAEYRKQQPVYTGFIKYFHDAIKEVANLSYVANEQHNPGTETHWDKSKSKDEYDALMRHLCDHASGEEFDSDGIRHLAKVAWRAMAGLQRAIDKENEAKR